MKITNLKNIFGGAALSLAILAGATAANAQQTQQTQPQDQQQTDKQWKHRGGGFRRGGEGFRRGGRHGGRHGGGEMRAFGQLNLTDAQKVQLKQIHQRYRESNKALFEQMRATKDSSDTTARENLRNQLKATHEQMRGELLAVLTPEQKTQLNQLKEQRKQQFEQRRKQRQAETPTNVN